MKAKFNLVLLLLVLNYSLAAQIRCATYNYQQKEFINDASLAEKINAIETFHQPANR